MFRIFRLFRVLRVVRLLRAYGPRQFFRDISHRTDEVKRRCRRALRQGRDGIRWPDRG